MKFCKIFEMKDGSQVLVKSYFDEGEANIDLETILPNGVTATLTNKVGYKESDTQETLLNRVKKEDIENLYYSFVNDMPITESDLKEIKELKIKVL